jgi:hypothetical protein
MQDLGFLTRRARASRGLGALTLPPTRAVVGGLCIAMAMLAALVLAGHQPDHRSRVLVIGRDRAVGSVLGRDDLAAARVDVPSTQRAALLSDAEADQVVGHALTRTLHAGEIITRSALEAKSPSKSAQSVALRLPLERALGGRLAIGDRVAAFATVDSCTSLVTGDAVVSALSSGSSGLGGNDIMVTLDTGRNADVLALVHAAQIGAVTIARAESITETLCRQGNPGATETPSVAHGG